MQELIIHTDFAQGSEEWYRLRLGKISASSFDKLLGTKAARNKYLCQKASERHTLVRSDSSKYTNYHMERGHLYEQVARDTYTNKTFDEVQQVGLLQLGDDVVCSPDGLVGNDGILEIKIHDSDIYFEKVELLHKKGVSGIPKQYYMQTQVNLYVSGRSWCDYVLYNPTHDDVKTGIYIYRIERDLELMDTIKLAIEKAVEEISQKVINFKNIFKI
jgi:hypothetical protein